MSVLSKEKGTIQVLMDLVTGQLIQDQKGARAGSSAMRVYRAPLYEFIGCDHTLGKKCIPCNNLRISCQICPKFLLFKTWDKSLFMEEVNLKNIRS